GLLLVRVEHRRGAMRVAVVCELVALIDDLANAVGMSFRDAARHEERRADPVPAQDVEDQGDADLRTVRSLGEDARLVRVLRVLADPDLLRVEVEGERGGGGPPGGPGHALCGSVRWRRFPSGSWKLR